MRTRREFLQGALTVPFAAAAERSTGLRIIAASDCLSQESAAGFQSVLAGSHAANLIVLCGAIAFPPRLHAEAEKGAWVVWEMSPSLGITVSPGDLYVRYKWPHVRLTRSFLRVIPLRCTETEAIAHYRGTPVALKRRIGRGGIVVLGSMLGPNLRAEEPEAGALAAAIFSEIACGGTSRAASTST